MSTQSQDAVTWPRAVRLGIEDVAATLMLGLQMLRERPMHCRSANFYIIGFRVVSVPAFRTF